MPIVEVTYRSEVGDDALARLAQVLPHAVSGAVACPEEPYDQELEPGDVEIRFRELGPHDVSGLDVVVEIRSKWFASRADNRQARCEQLRDALVDTIGGPTIGVYLSLPVTAWSQGT